MKKRVLGLLIVSLVLIVLISLNFVSAETISQWATSASATSYYSDGWKPEFAIGVSDAPCGTNPSNSAWCKETRLGTDHINLTFSTSVYASGLEIYFSGASQGYYNIEKVELIKDDGSSEIVWQGTNDLCILSINFPERDYLTNKVKITTKSNWWGQIDAVNLIGADTPSSTPQPTPIPTTCPSSMVSYWKFDSDAEDILGFNDGQLLNGASIDTSFKKVGSGALNLDGTNDYVKVPNSDSLRLQGSFTIEAWVYQTSVRQAGIVSKRSAESGDWWHNTYELYVGNPSSSVYKYAFWNGENCDFASACTGSNNPPDCYRHGQADTLPVANQWRHIAVTYDADTNVTTYYVNGSEDGVCEGCVFNPQSYTDAPLLIGFDGVTTYNFYFKGYIDEVAIYNSTLTAQDIASHYNNGEGEDYCEAPTPTPTPGEAYWANMNDVSINTADLNDKVKLNLAGAGLTGEINYTIYKDVWWWFDKKVAQTSTKGFTTWRANTTGTYYFKAVLSQGGTEETSGNLDVSNTEDNSPPTARIINPVIDSKEKVETLINFDGEIADEDDDLSVEWKFGDGNSTIFNNCLTTGGCNTQHKYINKGTKVIKLKVEEMAREPAQTAENYSRVFIYDEGINIFAVINEPSFGKIFGTGSNRIHFDASASYVAECENGICPDTTCYDVRDLKCYNIHEPNTAEGGLVGYELYFNWIFSEGAGRNGTWADYDDVVVFDRFFEEPRTHWANLKVGYNKTTI